MSVRKSVTRVMKWGNSLAIRVPADIARMYGLDKGSYVAIVPERDGLKIKCQSDLERMLDQITEENRHSLVDWGDRAGNEVW